MKKKNCSIVSIIFAIVFSFSAISYATNIAYINYGGGNVDYLIGYGNTVTYFNNPLGLTLSRLSGYDVALVASNFIFSQPSNIGNVLGDFANAGHGVVLTQFDFQGQWALSGKIMTHGYSPFTVDLSNDDYYIRSNIGRIYIPSSALLSGITTSNLVTNYQADVGLDTGASLVADWASGRYAIAFNTLSNSSVVALNLFPDSYITKNEDNKHLVANAIAFASPGGEVPVPEPSTILLIGSGLLGLAGLRRKFKK